jgi:hypothetical protein
MSATGSITLVWGDGDNTFRFGIAQWRELQEKINGRRVAMGLNPIGPMTLLNSLRAKDAWPDDMRDVLRIGLVGAGMPIAAANRKLVRYFDNTPVAPHNLVAFAVLSAGLLGAPGDEISAAKKKDDRRGDEPIRFSAIYGTGAALGFTPQQVDEMSFWQLGACVDGYNEAHGGELHFQPMSDEEFDELVKRHEEYGQ